ncbi:MAG: LysR family transcriptional regulator [Pigmentiphaga sp.]|uniref:LysR family transcriptional regulator n=1 Tax=Pigmentiphaga sp. TaxID=1977564 RepID=UPI0029B8F9C0|nr:LysR family transcriptional regulator [Pigmentiphaga sp.]MDX3906207.1 LysR family transcriptional regulator [Pigmentiphaga sp.]
MFELKQLRQFEIVAEELNFRRAAERLHMSQPPLSVSIQNLEHEVGTRLLERSRHHVKLTPAGAVFLKEAQRTLRQARLCIERAQRAADGMEGLLRLSFVPSAALDLLPVLFKRFQREYPTVQLQLTAETTGRQVEALRRGTVDLALVVTPLTHQKGLKVTTLREQRFVLAVPAEHALSQQKKVRMKDLAEEPFISFPASEGPGFVSALLNACQQAGFSPRVVQEAAQMQTVLTMVAGGLGVALVPAAMRTVHMPDVAFLDIADTRTPPGYTLAFVHQADSDNPVVGAFLAVVQRTFKR